MIRLLTLVSLTLWCGVALSLPDSAAPAQAPDAPPSLSWVAGPATGHIGDVAEIAVPEGYVFLGPEDTRVLMELMQNPVSGHEMGFLKPLGDASSWSAVFEFEEVGYVEDDDKDELDADALLAGFREGNAVGNEERRARGWPEVEILGWEKPPFYDKTSHNLVWAIKAQSGGVPIVNYNVRLLGRRGVMSAVLIAEHEELAASITEFERVLGSYAYTQGNKYAEYKQGDKVAEYGLVALVGGGAAAVALKSGLLQKLWKPIALAVVMMGGFLERLFRRGAKKDA